MKVEHKLETKEVERVVKDTVTTELYHMELTKQEAQFMLDLFGSLNWTRLHADSPSKQFIGDVYNGLCRSGLSNWETGHRPKLGFANEAVVVEK